MEATRKSIINHNSSIERADMNDIFHFAVRIRRAGRNLPMIGLALLLSLTSIPGNAQRQKPAQVDQEEKIRDMVAFLQLLLNTLGSQETSVADKEVIITESYARIFRDAEVQIEDDLDENRTVITNKDVVAYLKDIDFFFEDVKFEFNIEKIESNTTANNQTYYKVSATRNLSGTAAGGKAVNNTIPRFIEINFDPSSQDLKIVSVYTNEFDESEALASWWKQLSLEWRRIFTERLNIADSVTTDDLKDMTAIQHLDISQNEYIQTIEPLSRLVSLKLLNLSQTSITDLTPIRNLTELVELNVSESGVEDLSPLRYATTLQRLNISHTRITDISVLGRMASLRNLQMRNTPVVDFSPIHNLKDLVYLDMRSTPAVDLLFLSDLDALLDLDASRTRISDLAPLAGSKLVALRIDSTNVSSIEPLQSCDSLQLLHANHTQIATLKPLEDVHALERVYCDQSKVTRKEAERFMASKHGVLVVYDSRDLRAWWDGLTMPWKSVLSRSAGIGIDPTKEELVILTHLDSVNLSNQPEITDLEPLGRLQQLTAVLAAHTAIDNLRPLENHTRIRHLDITGTRVQDLSVLRRFNALRVIAADETPIGDIEPLYALPRLQVLYADKTDVHDGIARELLERNPDCLVVYKSPHLKRWWRDVTGYWVRVFHAQMADTAATRENLHRLVERESIQFTNIPVKDLSALGEFVRLKRLHFSGTSIREIKPLESLRFLESLQASDGPLEEIGGLAEMAQLTSIDISNSAVDNLDALARLEHLQSIDASGTQIRKLDPLGNLPKLRTLDCSNTRVRKLSPVQYLSLETLKCFNTKVSPRAVEQFAQVNPTCRIVYFR